ncbi:MAG: VPLPA-CTERM sorting domain-containing protein [Deltaproteobacteria bacterium]|nr:VPLPA-CTERM sorting domain-containing protein [Deltaproteobacteria bacterium]
MNRIILLCLFAVTMSYAAPGMACMNIGNSAYTLSYDATIDFNDGDLLGLETGDIVTDQWEDSGVNFGDGVMKWSKYTMLGTPGLYGSVFTGPIGSIYFNQDVSAAAFQFYTLPTWSSSIKIQAKNNGETVDVIKIGRTGNWYQSDFRYAFSGIIFDELNFNTGALYWNLDNLKFTPVPIPAAIWMLAGGLLGLIGLKRKEADRGGVGQ